ncbi:Transcription factor steA [Ceratocystis fimbriata CBS 114723]|uniref:Transcription factor MST12 n=1 Tax=Ceratocystis fimbriata CBS 114723 TaxID=1035309 RepID=A0A2C5XDD7_9PEZI|nr:Transcription factor steA [Ceratocystis fimbriata CBS 114723]
MYYQNGTMVVPQKPETFMLSQEAQQALPADAQVALQQVDNLKYFLISAPVDWQPDQYIRRFLLPTGEYVSCVLWNTLFHITGTDIVRCLSFRFQAFGRPVKNSKKFEEGIFSDLRNLKSGTDASLEEPKSPFLDFLYKNNCIRTQKKQKVFYWYSVPHDRLFLDALERDLKREKMGQEATTLAVAEPALSFQYDSSQSLYEQLTKAQQMNSSSFGAQQVSQAQAAAYQQSASASYSQPQSTSPVMRSVDSMPPPQLMAQNVAPIVDPTMDPMGTYGAMAMASTMPQQSSAVKREADYSRVQYNTNGVPITQTHQRHASMPAYALEYSPAPSFVSSAYDDYGNRGLSFEPITPPQQAMGMGTEPAYIANEETGLYTAIPDHMANVNAMNGMLQLPASNISNPQFSRAYGANNVYSVIEGSPTYKQRRRRSSIPPPMQGMAPSSAPTSAGHGHAHSVSHSHRPSDLRRSVSLSVGPVLEDDENADNSPPSLYGNVSVTSNPQGQTQSKEAGDMSRHGTPLPTVEGSPAMNAIPLQAHEFSSAADDMADARSMTSGVVRRARSATVMELGPYPQKSHSCPIPTCGRLFKRLEHLKRHVRTHTQEKPYVCPHCSKAFSRSDNLAQHRRTHERPDGAEGSVHDEEEEFSGEDQMGFIDEASPNSDNAYIPVSLNSAMTSGTPQGNGNSVSVAPQAMGGYNSMQSLTMPVAMSAPTV